MNKSIKLAKKWADNHGIWVFTSGSIIWVFNSRKRWTMFEIKGYSHPVSIIGLIKKTYNG